MHFVKLTTIPKITSIRENFIIQIPPKTLSKVKQKVNIKELILLLIQTDENKKVIPIQQWIEIEMKRTKFTIKQKTKSKGIIQKEKISLKKRNHSSTKDAIQLLIKSHAHIQLKIKVKRRQKHLKIIHLRSRLKISTDEKQMMKIKNFL